MNLLWEVCWPMGESTTGNTRQRILIAAATMLGEDPTPRLSARQVAARAG